jgi:hypothetical protein
MFSGFQALLRSLRRYLPDLPGDHDEFVFQTNELPMCRGMWTAISEDAWEIVSPLVQMVRVVSSACNRSGWPGAAVPGPPNLAQANLGQEDSDQFRIFIKTLNGETLTILCSRSDTIPTVKSLIQDKKGFPTDQQVLILSGNRLDADDNWTLADYDIQKDSMLHLVFTLRAGKPVIYLYPPIATRISAKLSLTRGWEFSAIYPVRLVKNTAQGQEFEWVVDALPSGILKEVGTGFEMSYLYWEAE